MPKRKSRGNLQRQLKSFGFDVVQEMVELYPSLTPVGKLNALQTLLKYLHPEPKQHLIKVKAKQQLSSGIEASMSARLPSSPLLLEKLTELAATKHPESASESLVSVTDGTNSEDDT